MKITDAMVKAAVDAYKAPRLHVNDTQNDREIDMRAALRAALEVVELEAHTEWSVEYYALQPGNHASPTTESFARKWAEKDSEWVRLVKRTVLTGEWELVE